MSTKFRLIFTLFLFCVLIAPNIQVSAQNFEGSIVNDTVVTSDGVSYLAPDRTSGESSKQKSFAGRTDAYVANDANSNDLEKALPPVDTLIPGSVIGTDGRTRVTTTTTYPYRAIVFLKVTFADNTQGTCSGWFYGSRIIGTAGHCVYSAEHGGWAKSITAFPGRDGTYSPYGSTTSHRLFSVHGWTAHGMPDYDYGAIQVNSPKGNLVGWFGFRWQSSNTFTGNYTVTGYPGDKTYGTMWKMSGAIMAVTTYRLWYAIDTAGGQSGSPHYQMKSDGPYAVGYHTYGIPLSPYTQYNSSTRITQSVFNNMISWKNYAYP
jgi:glutamyl endopeptidase